MCHVGLSDTLEAVTFKERAACEVKAPCSKSQAWAIDIS